jgi:hypothetical protein
MTLSGRRRDATDIYRMSQEGRSIFWEVVVSVALRKKCTCTCVLLQTVSEIELFHSMDKRLAMSSHELQSVVMLMVEFLKMYYAS